MKHLRLVVLAVLVGTTAYLTGTRLGDFLLTREESSFRERRAALTEAAAAGHVQLGVGDTVPDFALEMIEGDTVSLWSALAQSCDYGELPEASGADGSPAGEFTTTYLIGVHPQCGTCVEEMAEIARYQAEHQTTGPFVFVSAANPRECQDVRDSLGLQSPFLYDHRGRFLYEFGLAIYPLVLVIDQDRTVQEMILGTLLQSEIADAIITEEKNPE